MTRTPFMAHHKPKILVRFQQMRAPLAQLSRLKLCKTIGPHWSMFGRSWPMLRPVQDGQIHRFTQNQVQGDTNSDGMESAAGYVTTGAMRVCHAAGRREQQPVPKAYRKFCVQFQTTPSVQTGFPAVIQHSLSEHLKCLKSKT
jgi:hypothetical protein